MSEITKEEISLLVEVQGKTVVNLEKIANSLKEIVEEQEEVSKLQKDVYKELISGSILSKLDKIHFDVVFSKYLFGSIGVIVIVASVIMKLMNGG